MHVRGIAAVQLLHGCVVSRARPPVENVRGRARWIVVHRTARHRRDIYPSTPSEGKDSGMCRGSGCTRPAAAVSWKRPARRSVLGWEDWEQRVEGSGGEGPGAFGGPTPAGGGDSSNGRQPLRPTRNHRRGPAPCTAASGRRLKKKGCR